MIAIEGTNSDKVKNILESMDEEARYISHITFGTNEFIKDTMGEVFLIERKTKGMTIGLGNNLGAFQGKNKSKNHIDFSSEFPKLEIISSNGSIKL